jgi:hypothetical protein
MMETFPGKPREARGEESAGLQAARRGTPPAGEPGAGRPAPPFVPPRLTRHEPLTRITLVSGNDFPGSGGAGGTFFGG